jgi:hypothetical protein
MLRIGHAGYGERPLETAALLDRVAECQGTGVLALQLGSDDVERILGDLLVPCLAKRVRLALEVLDGDPLAVLSALTGIAARLGRRRPRVGVLEGHNLLATQLPAVLAALRCDPPPPPGFALAAAEVELGSEPLLGLIAKGAEILVTGIVAPSAVPIAFARHAHRWQADDFDRLAAAACVGRILRAGAASVGGDLDEVVPASGLPFADISADGTARFHATHGGPVRVAGLALALLDGLAAPTQWVEPDVTVDLGNAALHGSQLQDIAGGPAAEWIAGRFVFEGGHIGAAEIAYGGGGAAARGRAAARDIEMRLAALPGDARCRVEVVGFDAAAKAAGEQVRDLAVAPGRDVRVRVAVRGETGLQVEAALAEARALVRFGPSGGALLHATAARERRVSATRVDKVLVSARATQITGDL